MFNWIAVLAFGLLLGCLLYLCVRIRGAVIPTISARIGPKASGWIWIVTIVVMILISNLSLIGLRMGLLWIEPDRSTLIYEIFFALISFVLALYLVRYGACRQNCLIFRPGNGRGQKT